MNVVGRACDASKSASVFICASQKVNNWWYRRRDGDGEAVAFTWGEVKVSDKRAHNICRGLAWEKSEFKRVLEESCLSSNKQGCN